MERPVLGYRWLVCGLLLWMVSPGSGEAGMITEILTDSQSTYPAYIELNTDGLEGSFDLVLLSTTSSMFYVQRVLRISASPSGTVVVHDGVWPRDAGVPQVEGTVASEGLFSPRTMMSLVLFDRATGWQAGQAVTAPERWEGVEDVAVLGIDAPRSLNYQLLGRSTVHLRYGDAALRVVSGRDGGSWLAGAVNGDLRFSNGEMLTPGIWMDQPIPAPGAGVMLLMLCAALRRRVGSDGRIA